MGYYVAGLEVLSEPCKRALKTITGSDEKILYCVASRQKRPNVLERDRGIQMLTGYRNWLDGLVFLDERLIFIHGPKFGFVVLGDVEQTPLNYSSIDYVKVTSISLDSPPGAHTYFIVNNVSMIMPKHAEFELRQLENWLRKCVREKSREVTVKFEATVNESKDVFQQIEKLTELHRRKEITDEEFALLKKKLLEE